MQSNAQPTSEDKIWAAIAHASALFSFWGPILPAILWFLQRRKSAYIRFHALQAVTYQVTCLWVGHILLPLFMIAAFVAQFASIATITSRPNDPMSGLGMMMPVLIYVPFLAAWGLYVLVSLIGAVASLTGGMFLYPFIGGPLRRKLGYQLAADGSIAEDQEDQVVAAVSHATCIVPMFGAVVPLILWITQKDRGGFIRFQTLQALVYQGLGAAAYLIFWALYVVFIFVLFGVSMLLLGPGQAGSSANTGSWALALGFLVPMLCVGLLFFIGGPLYQLFGFIASLRSLRGNDYNYPLLGRFLRKRSEAPSSPAMEAAK